MVWQRAGTVAVQNGSTTVVGTSVDFAASSRNGDSFVGPDGATYEVANVASSTVISILPAYKGPTVTGAAYAIMPVQGYDKMLSDAFNSLNNQFGPKLAALGTTGNYDILPVAKGGTGSSNQSDARSALGLGAVSTESILPVAKGGTGSDTQPGARTALGLGTASQATITTSQVDSTANRVLKVADWGVGTDAVPLASTVNINQSGFWRWDSTTAFYGNYGALNGSIISCGYGGELCAQIYIGRINTNLIGFRSAGGNFNQIYHTGNTTRAADGTLKAI